MRSSVEFPESESNQLFAEQDNELRVANSDRRPRREHANGSWHGSDAFLRFAPAVRSFAGISVSLAGGSRSRVPPSFHAGGAMLTLLRLPPLVAFAFIPAFLSDP